MPELKWQKSSFSGDDANRDCVEVAVASGGEAMLVREWEEPGTVLQVTSASFRALLGVFTSPSA